MRNKIIAILSAIIVLLGGGVAVDQLGSGRDASFNRYSSLTSSATSTGSYFYQAPVEVLELDANRRYVHIHNNSNTEMHLFCRNTPLDYTGTGAENNATTTITELTGITLAPEDADNLDDDYIMDNSNMCYGFLYATSTGGATKKELLINYK